MSAGRLTFLPTNIKYMFALNANLAQTKLVMYKAFLSYSMYSILQFYTIQC